MRTPGCFEADAAVRILRQNGLSEEGIMQTEMTGFYDSFAAVYDRMGVSEYSESVGEGILRYFSECFPGEKLQTHLDLGCGTGVLCALMAEEGIGTAGIDISEKMIQKARNSYPGLSFEVADAASCSAGGGFDLVTCIDDVVNHFTGPGELKRLFATACMELRPGGFFIFDFIQSEKLPAGESYTAAEEGGESLEYQIVRKEDSIIDIHVRYLKNEKAVWEKINTEKLYDAATIESYLKETGFEKAEIREEFYGADSLFKSVCIARKPG